MKISVEAYTTLYLAFSRIFINIWYNQSPGSKGITENLKTVLSADDLKEHAHGLKIFFWYLKNNGILEVLEKYGNAL